MPEKHALATNPAHLGLGATAVPQPEFSGMEWYEAYAQRVAVDGREGRLVALHTFSESWDSWEMHPEGEELVLCVAGEITLVQDMGDGKTQDVTIGAGEYIVNPPGVWHSADVKGEATAVFITAGMGTQHRPR